MLPEGISQAQGRVGGSRRKRVGRTGPRRYPAAPRPHCGTGGPRPRRNRICTPTAKAKLLSDGELIPPASAPPRVKAVIAAANKIRTKPYIWGGGHASWWARGYDCSGSVSFALHGGGFLESPLPSGPMESWGAPGQRPLDHRLCQRRPRLRGNRRRALGHRRATPPAPAPAGTANSSATRVRGSAPARLLRRQTQPGSILRPGQPVGAALSLLS